MESMLGGRQNQRVAGGCLQSPPPPLYGKPSYIGRTPVAVLECKQKPVKKGGDLVEGETWKIKISLCLLLFSRKTNPYEQQMDWNDDFYCHL